MDELKYMLGKDDARNAPCHAPEECRHCGYEIHEADRRKRKINTNGLTRRKDGLLGLVLRR